MVNSLLVSAVVTINICAAFVAGVYWTHHSPCEYEDSEWCYWNASTMGNGQGQSFIRIFNNTFYFGDNNAQD